MVSHYFPPSDDELEEQEHFGGESDHDGRTPVRTCPTLDFLELTGLDHAAGQDYRPYRDGQLSMDVTSIVWFRYVLPL